MVREGLFGTAASLRLDRLPAMELRERASGRGTIRFGGWGMTPLAWRQGVWTPPFDPTPQFLAVGDARRVYDRIERASRDAA